MSKISEDELERGCVELLRRQGYAYIAPEELEAERADRSDVVLKGRLRVAIERLNRRLPPSARDDAFRRVTRLPSQSLIDNNQALHRWLTDGVELEYRREGETVGGLARLIDFKDLLNNDFAVCNQFTVAGAAEVKRPDVVLFVNGLPLVVFELKRPNGAGGGLDSAYNQLQNYKAAIPDLFAYNGVLVVSDGYNAKAGSLTAAALQNFREWKTVDGIKPAATNVNQLETLIKGMLRPAVLLDLLRHFTFFERTRAGLVKKIAAYHQYHAVNLALESTLRAADRASAVGESPALYGLPTTKGQPRGDRKIGFVWHTQGSGKSLSMLFYAGKLIADVRFANPTVVVVTDRNDLDDQLFETFVGGMSLLRQDPVQARDKGHLRSLLRVNIGGVVFTTIQKFFPDGDNEEADLLSDRENIIVIADEAHRSHYGFGAKTRLKQDAAFVRYGFAKYLRDALPRASFIGFTATPIELERGSTQQVFGNYLDVYDIHQSIEDKATAPIYYESRLVQVHLDAAAKERLDDETADIGEGDEGFAARNVRKWAQVEAIVGHPQRLARVARDIASHFEERQEVFKGKGLIVTMSRRIAVALYDELIKLRPEWRADALKVVMTSTVSDPPEWQPHNTDKDARRELAERFKNPADPLKLAIVRDMWLTGFDAPCLHTMYLDKPMRGHALMQAIARVNRVYKDKPGGSIVDYIGVASDLKQALKTYTQSGGRGEPTLDQSKAIDALREHHEVVSQMFAGFDYGRYFAAGAMAKMDIILAAQEHILGLDDGKARFVKNVTALSKAFALSVPSQPATELRGEVGFFQAVKTRLLKFEPSDYGGGAVGADVETAVKQIIEAAIVADEALDVFGAAGLDKPQISILSDEFLAEVREMSHPRVAIELLRKILSDEFRTRLRKNFIQNKRLSELLQQAINKYRNNLLTAAEVVAELIELAKETRAVGERGVDLNLKEDEVAFYDALAQNGSAREVMGDDTLRELAQILVGQVRADATLDWTIKENVRAKLRFKVKNTLRKYGYPPDKAKIATDNILKQAELLADDWSAGAS